MNTEPDETILQNKMRDIFERQQKEGTRFREISISRPLTWQTADTSDIKTAVEIMKAYLLLKLDQGDWHGVADAANDIREMLART